MTSERNYSKWSIYHRDLSDFEKPLSISEAVAGKGDRLVSQELFFPFYPTPKGRPRFTRTGHAYTPKKTSDYEQNIADYYKLHNGIFFEGPIEVKIIFYMPIPKGTPKRVLNIMKEGDYPHTKKPDLDNLAKAMLDALNGVAFTDDSNITALKLSKTYNTSPGIWLAIKEVCN